MIYWVTWILVRIVLRCLFRYSIRGAENVPRTGAVILAGNHVSYLDPPVVAVGFGRPAAYMAKEELFRNRLFGWYCRSLGAFPVRRGVPDRAAIKHSLDALSRGEVLVMFPEGTRSLTGELKEPEIGVGMIACRSGAPVIPVYISGTRNVLPARGRLRFGRITVTYGRPILLPEQAVEKPGREEYDGAARRIMAAIAALRDQRAKENP